jgi:hypothetical protein
LLLLMLLLLMQLKPPGVEKLINRVLDCEGEASHWSLKDRLVLVNDVLDGFAAAGALCNMLYVTYSNHNESCVCAGTHAGFSSGSSSSSSRRSTRWPLLP